jgi:hypothetical protein
VTRDSDRSANAARPNEDWGSTRRARARAEGIAQIIPFPEQPNEEEQEWSFNPTLRGNHIVFRKGETNHCPGCGRKAWFVGRIMAECANERCVTALVIEGARR